jgi:hypothetical protein
LRWKPCSDSLDSGFDESLLARFEAVDDLVPRAESVVEGRALAKSGVDAVGVRDGVRNLGRRAVEAPCEIELLIALILLVLLLIAWLSQGLRCVISLGLWQTDSSPAE